MKVSSKYIKIWKGIFNEDVLCHATSWLYFYLVVKFTSVCLPVNTACKNMYKCKTQSLTFTIFLPFELSKKKKDFFLSTFHLAYRINKPVRLAHVYVSNSLAVSSAWNYVTHKKFCTPKSAFHFKSILKKKKKKRDLWTRALSGIYYWQG